MAKGVSGFVYAIGADWLGPVKIGVAVDVMRRVERLQSGNHVQLSLLWQSGPFDDPFAIEAQLHNAFAAHRIRGEWFQIPGLSSELLSGAVDGAKVAVRLQPEPDEESRVAASVCLFLIERLRREGMNADEAIGSLASTSKLSRSTVWALLYRPPTQIMIGPYGLIAQELWRVSNKPPFDNDVPYVKDVLATLAEAEALRALATKIEARKAGLKRG